MMVSIFVKTWSLKQTVDVVSERLHVSKGSLRGDWHRRHRWPKEVFDQISDPILSEFYHIGIHQALRQIEVELCDCKNPSCRVGLLRAKAEILFKLMEVQRSIVQDEAVMKRIESMEEELRFLKSNGQNCKVK
jgi:hypothetical protein